MGNLLGESNVGASTSAMPASTSEITSFSAFKPPLSPNLINTLRALSIDTPTPVQVACIPQVLGRKDVIAQALTGSGKTLAFALPILQELGNDPRGVYALVITPTRELALQLADQFHAVGSSLNVSVSCILGGMDQVAQARELSEERPHVIIATPGRLHDLMQSSSIKGDGEEWGFGRIEVLVMDEADRLLTNSFAPSLAYILERIPPKEKRQTLFFTATISEPLLGLSEREKESPTIGKQKPFLHLGNESIAVPASLRQLFCLVPPPSREVYLYCLLLRLCHYTGASSPSELVSAAQKTAQITDNQRGGGSNKKSKPKLKSKNPLAPPDLEPLPQTILFVTHPKTAAMLSLFLSELPTPIPSVTLHSHLSQPQRISNLSRFRSRAVPLLIATDVASRGLDLECGVECVINWEMPNTRREEGKGGGKEGEDEYIHRVGRTARLRRGFGGLNASGEPVRVGGVAVTFVGGKQDVEGILKLEERINMKMQELTLPNKKIEEYSNVVNLAKAQANLTLHEEGFGKKEEMQRKKNKIKAEMKQDDEKEAMKRLKKKKTKQTLTSDGDDAIEA